MLKKILTDCCLQGAQDAWVFFYNSDFFLQHRPGVLEVLDGLIEIGFYDGYMEQFYLNHPDRVVRYESESESEEEEEQDQDPVKLKTVAESFEPKSAPIKPTLPIVKQRKRKTTIRHIVKEKIIQENWIEINSSSDDEDE